MKPGDIVICSGEVQGPGLRLNKARGVVLEHSAEHEVYLKDTDVYLVRMDNEPHGPWLLYGNQLVKETDIQ